MKLTSNKLQQNTTEACTWWRHQMETFSALLAIVRGIHRSPVNSPHKSQWRGALMFSLICVWINGWVNNHKAGDLRRHRGHYDVIVMWIPTPETLLWCHNEHDGVSNHQPHDCLRNHLFRCRSKEYIKAPRHWPLWELFNSPVAGEFPAHRASNS